MLGQRSSDRAAQDEGHLAGVKTILDKSVHKESPKSLLRGEPKAKLILGLQRVFRNSWLGDSNPRQQP